MFICLAQLIQMQLLQPSSLWQVYSSAPSYRGRRALAVWLPPCLSSSMLPNVSLLIPLMVPTSWPPCPLMSPRWLNALILCLDLDHMPFQSFHSSSTTEGLVLTNVVNFKEGQCGLGFLDSRFYWHCQHWALNCLGLGYQGPQGTLRGLLGFCFVNEETLI